MIIMTYSSMGKDSTDRLSRVWLHVCIRSIVITRSTTSWHSSTNWNHLSVPKLLERITTDDTTVLCSNLGMRLIHGLQNFRCECFIDYAANLAVSQQWNQKLKRKHAKWLIRCLPLHLRLCQIELWSLYHSVGKPLVVVQYAWTQALEESDNRLSHLHVLLRCAIQQLISFLYKQLQHLL